MKNLDLEKVIILLSLLLMPVAGGWIYMMDTELKQASVAFKSSPATIQEIHGLHELIRLTKKELLKPGESIDDAGQYFQNRLIASQKKGSIVRADQITVKTNTTQVRRKGGRGKPIGEDIEANIQFGKGQRGGMPLPRSFINAFIFNSEMAMPIWKLRNLKMTNKDFKGLRGQMAPKTLEISDEWIINDLVFARRKPIGK